MSPSAIQLRCIIGKLDQLISGKLLSTNGPRVYQEGSGTRLETDMQDAMIIYALQ
jgi:hypothetical protein